MAKLSAGLVALIAGGLVAFALLPMAASPRAAADRFPDPVKTGPDARGTQTAVFAGGCFWGVEGVFESLQGVSDAVSGYAGDSKETAKYEIVSGGATNHAESVKVTYDPSKISYGQLLKIFFAIAHDPTQLDRQGPDDGPRSRSSIFVLNQDQQQVAEAYIKQLNDAGLFRNPIVTTVVKLDAFYPAEDYHQDYMRKNPNAGYIVVYDQPKLDALKRDFPELVKPSSPHP